jgi:hypothetical protein
MKNETISEQKKYQLARVLADVINRRDEKRYSKILGLIEKATNEAPFMGDRNFSRTGLIYHITNLENNYKSNILLPGTPMRTNLLPEELTPEGGSFYRFIKRLAKRYLPNQVQPCIFAYNKTFGLWKFSNLNSMDDPLGLTEDTLKEEKAEDGKHYVTESAVKRKIDDFEEFYNFCKKLNNAFKDPSKLENSLRKIDNFENKELDKIMGDSPTWYNKFFGRNKK